MKTAAEAIQTLTETLTPPSPPKTLAGSQRKRLDEILRCKSEGQRRAWLDARLRLQPTHPDLLKLEDSVFQFACEFSANPRRGRRIVIQGSNGIGKSMTMRAIARFIRDHAIDMPLVHRDEGLALADYVLVNWAARVDDFKAGHWDIDDMLECSLLILDDVGAEHDPSGVGASKLYHLLERRERKWTIITTNVPPSDWERKWERRIADRLMRHSELVDLSQVPSYSAMT